MYLNVGSARPHPLLVQHCNTITITPFTCWLCTCICVQVIEAIRSSNNDEFFEAMESGKHFHWYNVHVYVHFSLYVRI